jgi:hypothetical protein
LTGRAAIPTVVAIAAGAAVYASMLFFGGAITEEELLLLPGGKRLAKPLRALRERKNQYFFRRKH